MGRKLQTECFRSLGSLRTVRSPQNIGAETIIHEESQAFCCSRNIRSQLGQVFSEYFGFPCQSSILPIAPQSPSSIIWGFYNRPEVTAVPSGLSPTPLKKPVIWVFIYSSKVFIYCEGRHKPMNYSHSRPEKRWCQQWQDADFHSLIETNFIWNFAVLKRQIHAQA
jgi:hypothetical protein